MFPTCFIEYMEPAIGQDLVKVYERNGVACSLPEGTRAAAPRGCTRATSRSSPRRPQRNVTALAAEVRAGRDVVVRPADLRLCGQEGLPALPAARRWPPTPHWWPSTPPTRPST